VSEQRQVTLEFLAEQQHRILSEIRILRDDVDVLAASMRPIDNSYDRLERRTEMVLTELREMRAELRAMHAQQDRTAARVRTLEEERE
jgi:ElaB/YqjD/DUF883 family membrane-anchored ribosome-binding protein